MTTPRPQTEATEARWYVVDKSGAATLCVDQQDAIEVARESQNLYPQHAPYSAVRLVPAQSQNPTGWRDIAPKEWKLVPVEPTDEMETAAEDDYEQRGETFPDWKSKWRAMLAAAPAHPAEQQEATAVAKDKEQSAFEGWFSRVSPSGDVEAVQRQWEASSDYADLYAEQQEGDAAGEKDAAMLDWMAAEECCIESVITLDGTRYQIHWPDLAETQTECYLTPRAAIGAAMQAMKGEGNHG